jgi:hypothetical protein
MGFGVFDRDGGLREEAPITHAVHPIDPHPSGHSWAHVRRHENGHARVCRALGGRARVDLKAGETHTWGRFTPTEHAAISYGGRAAAGPSGCQFDDADIDHYVSQGADRSAAWRIARRYA